MITKAILLLLTGASLVLPSLTRAGADASPTPLRVGSFNVRYLNDTDGLNGWANRRDHLRELIDFYEWDLFGVQEAVTEQMADLAELTRYRALGVGRNDGRESGEFTAIYYDHERFEVQASGTFWLSPTPDEPSRGWDARQPRICTWARLWDRANHTVFYFFNTHLEHQGAEARREGAKVLVQRGRQIVQGAAPVIVVGDFNCTDNEEPYVTMTAWLQDARKVTKTPPYGPDGTFNGFDPALPFSQMRRIDYIFVSPEIDVQRQAHLPDMRDGRYPSDHLPIMAKLVLPAAAPQ
jgi:endonuclease/exonuclease/phosphatase family metal-dependent hydrolase